MARRPGTNNHGPVLPDYGTGHWPRRDCDAATPKGVRRKQGAWHDGKARRRAKLVRKPDISQMCNKRICVRNCMSTHFKSTLSMYGQSGRRGPGGMQDEGKLGGFSGALVVANATINKYEIKI